jgi:hypothetical protein
MCMSTMLGRLVAWVTYDVCRMIMKTLCVLPLAMKHFNAMSAFIL